MKLVAAAVVAAAVVGGYLWWSAPASRGVATIGSADAFACQPPSGVHDLAPASASIPRPAPGTVPEDFVPVKAVVCDSFTGDRVDADKTATYSEHHYAGDFSDALEQLNAGSGRRPLLPGQCGVYDLAVVEDMWLLDADGRAVQPSYPLHGCGYQNTLGLYTVRSLPEVETVEHRVELTDDTISVYYGCSPVLSLPTPGAALVDTDVLSGGGLCRFDVSGPVPMFDGIRGYDPGRLDLLTDLLRTSAPAGDCTESASAVVATSVTGLDTIDWEPVQVMVELDGCRRILADGYLPLGPISGEQARLLAG
ncbi:hypothetical protein [Rhodococcoides yunnanense]|uniref:hypothetical protein n=1 Tax=Rhodococcoides yunnanense TaxID=278209 RepID=UPI000933760C|nr:hypothetical protein [Rhodococcus yunnanensis]